MQNEEIQQRHEGDDGLKCGLPDLVMREKHACDLARNASDKRCAFSLDAEALGWEKKAPNEIIRRSNPGTLKRILREVIAR